MPNKTIYISDDDLPLWEAAQKELKKSISSLFAEFLRERIHKMDVFVHVLRSTDSGMNFTVLFAPTGRTGTGGPMKPHNIQGKKPLIKFLVESGLTQEAAEKMEADVSEQGSVSERMLLPKSIVGQRF